jgi:hypothetical protein
MHIAFDLYIGIRVEDIMRKNRSQLHSLTSFARVRRTRITYLTSEGSRLLPSHVRTSRREKGLPARNDRNEEWH